MQVILLERIVNLGNLGDVVNVKPGFARNFLVPKGLATMASEENLKAFEERRSELEKASADKLQASQARAKELDGVTLNIASLAGDEGRLFGSVGIIEIVEAFAKQDLSVSKSEVQLPEGPIKVVGEHAVVISVHPEVNFTVNVVVEAE